MIFRSGGSQKVARVSQRGTSGDPWIGQSFCPSPRSAATPLRRLLVLCGVFLSLASAAYASDHNNLDHGRPLQVEDAYSIAFGERTLQTGVNWMKGRVGWSTDFQYGFAKNQDLSLGFDKAFDGSAGVVSASFFQNLCREVDDRPALGFRVGIEGKSQSGELLVTKSWHQYDKLHLNLDFDSSANPNMILGYSLPLGYPGVFDRTLVAEVGHQGATTSFGVGIRQQTGPTSVFDIGIRASSGIQVVGGYSRSF